MNEEERQSIEELLVEVRSLRADIELLKASPVIGQAVDAALRYGRSLDNGGYAVLCRSIELPESSYNVLVAPAPDFGDEAEDA